MAMHRANFAKLLEPGLNTLFLSTINLIQSGSLFLRLTLQQKPTKKMSFLKVSAMLRLKRKVQQSAMMKLASNGQLVISMKQLHWPSQ